MLDPLLHERAKKHQQALGMLSPASPRTNKAREAELQFVDSLHQSAERAAEVKWQQGLQLPSGKAVGQGKEHQSYWEKSLRGKARSATAKHSEMFLAFMAQVLTVSGHLVTCAVAQYWFRIQNAA